MTTSFAALRSPMVRINQRAARRRAAAALGSIVLAAGLFGSSFLAWGQDQGAATAKDVIFARKTLMTSISDNMDQIETMISSGKLDIAHGQEHADTVSVMLMAFPHLFPPASNQWKPNVSLDAGADTFASPDVWTKFADFYARATAASTTAFNLSRADKDDEFKSLTKELRVACDTCHAMYLKAQ